MGQSKRHQHHRPARLRLIAAALVVVAIMAGCSGGYSRQDWHDTFTDRYGLSGSSAACIMDGVEANGLEDRFTGDSVDLDYDLERIIRACDLPITERVMLGVGW